MKMQVNWQAIINFILFAMLVVAFTFSIWSYVKSNAIKNSNSPSLPDPASGQPIINDNNTYVNNIASAPTLVSIGALAESDNLTYKVKSTDNGSIIAVAPNKDNYIVNFDFANVQSIPGFYVKVSNSFSPLRQTPYTIIVNSFINGSTPYSTLTISSGKSAYIGFEITNLFGGNTYDLQLYSYADADVFA